MSDRHTHPKQTCNQILDHVHVGKRTDRANLVVLGNLCQTRQTILSIDVHRTRTANTLTARSTTQTTQTNKPSESKSRILLVLDLKQSIQHHGSTTTN